jgi:hypothetical protein
MAEKVTCTAMPGCDDHSTSLSVLINGSGRPSRCGYLMVVIAWAGILLGLDFYLDLRAFLRSCKLEHLHDKFVEQEVTTVAALAHASRTEEHMHELGIVVGARQRFVSAVQLLAPGTTRYISF